MDKTLTILLAINKKFQDVDLAKQLLEDQASKLSFLNPKTVLVDDIANYEDYSVFCIKRLADCFDTDFVLIVQFDGLVLCPASWSDIFYEYDYIGAPWRRDMLEIKPTNFTEDHLVGNGGFSLRSKKLCEFIKNNSSDYIDKDQKILNEDVYICQKKRNFLIKNGFNFAPYKIAKQFSVENYFYDYQLGAHSSIFLNGKFARIRYRKSN